MHGFGKVKTEFEMGEERVESVEFIKMKTALIHGNTRYEPAVEYYIAIKLADKKDTVETDVAGTFELSRKALKAKDTGFKDPANRYAPVDIPKVDDMKVDFAFPVFYKNTWTTDADKYLVDGDEVVLEYKETYALKFDYDDEVEFQFGDPDSGLNEGTFTVDVSGQGKIFINWNTDADEAIAAANKNAQMNFVNFGNVKFNRSGEFVYELEDIAAAYQIVNGKLVEIPGAEFEDDQVTFRTNLLGSYVFAKAELVNP
jgi:hypothetical protein